MGSLESGGISLLLFFSRFWVGGQKGMGSLVLCMQLPVWFARSVGLNWSLNSLISTGCIKVISH